MLDNTINNNYLCTMNYKEVFFMGDVHGGFNSIFQYIFNGKDMTNCLVIQVGDFGVGFTNKRRDEENLMLTNSLLEKAGCDCIVIRGNHDDPAFFKGEHYYSNLKLVPDYTYMTINNQNFLFVGGAISIDRVPRIKRDSNINTVLFSGRSYFKGEEFKFSPKKVKSEKVDVLVTHTAPSWCFPQNKDGFGRLVESYMDIDKNLGNDLNKERTQVDKLFNLVSKYGDITQHYYGHFHNTDILTYGSCRHYLIDQDTVVKHDIVSDI